MAFEYGTIDSNDNERSISELQTYLYGISYFDPDIPRVLVDGQPGAETEAAVRALQQKYGIEPSSPTAPFETWQTARNLYIGYTAAVLPGDPFIPLYRSSVLERLEQHPSLVAQLQLAFNIVRRRIPSIPQLEINSIITPPFRVAVRIIQRIYRLPENGEIDTKTFEAIANAYNHAMRLEQTASDRNPGDGQRP